MAAASPAAPDRSAAAVQTPGAATRNTQAGSGQQRKSFAESTQIRLLDGRPGAAVPLRTPSAVSGEPRRAESMNDALLDPCAHFRYWGGGGGVLQMGFTPSVHQLEIRPPSMLPTLDQLHSSG